MCLLLFTARFFHSFFFSLLLSHQVFSNQLRWLVGWLVDWCPAADDQSQQNGPPGEDLPHRRCWIAYLTRRGTNLMLKRANAKIHLENQNIDISIIFNNLN
jgi:hypothetical protein